MSLSIDCRLDTDRRIGIRHSSGCSGSRTADPSDNMADPGKNSLASNIALADRSSYENIAVDSSVDSNLVSNSDNFAGDSSCCSSDTSRGNPTPMLVPSSWQNRARQSPPVQQLGSY